MFMKRVVLSVEVCDRVLVCFWFDQDVIRARHIESLLLAKLSFGLSKIQ